MTGGKWLRVVDAMASALHGRRSWWHRWGWASEDHCSECFVSAAVALDAATEVAA